MDYRFSDRQTKTTGTTEQKKPKEIDVESLEQLLRGEFISAGSCINFNGGKRWLVDAETDQDTAGYIIIIDEATYNLIHKYLLKLRNTIEHVRLLKKIATQLLFDSKLDIE